MENVSKNIQFFRVKNTFIIILDYKEGKIVSRRFRIAHRIDFGG